MELSKEIVKTLRNLIKLNLSDLHLTKKRGHYQALQLAENSYDYYMIPKGLDLSQLYESLTKLFSFDPFQPHVQDARCTLRIDNKEVTLFAFFLPLIDGDRLELRMTTVK